MANKYLKKKEKPMISIVWDFLVEKLSFLDDDNFTAREIYDFIDNIKEEKITTYMK